MRLALPRFVAERPAPFWALLFALVVLALAVADAVLRFGTERPNPSAQLPPVLRPSTARPFDIQQIIRSHLFGQSDAPAAKTVAAPDTRLRLRLVGVVASTDPEQARAMIATDGGKARSFAVGRPITGTDGTLHAIEGHRVLIRRGGAIEQLKLERKPRDDRSAPITSAPGVLGSPADASGAAPQVSMFGSGVPASAPPVQESEALQRGQEEAPEESARPEEEGADEPQEQPAPVAPAPRTRAQK